MLQDFFFMGICESSTGNQERYNRIDIEPGLWALAIEIPSTTDESSSGGGGWDASLPAVKFLQAFWFAFQQLQVSGGRFPSLWALALHLSSHVCSFVAWQTCALSNKWILRSFCQFSRERRRKVLTHLRVLAAHPMPFFRTVSISTIYCLIINTQRCSKHGIIHAYPALYDRSMNLM